MRKYDVLYCSTTERTEGSIKKLRDYFRDSKWLTLMEERAAGDTILTHLRKGFGSAVFYRGSDWVHLNIVV